jgi:hypothetical protein
MPWSARTELGLRINPALCERNVEGIFKDASKKSNSIWTLAMGSGDERMHSTRDVSSDSQKIATEMTPNGIRLTERTTFARAWQRQEPAPSLFTAARPRRSNRFCGFEV